MDSYNYSKAILLCEMHLKNKADIAEAVNRERQKRKGLRSHFYSGIGLKDPTAYIATNNLNEISLVTYMDEEGEVHSVSYPERWLEIFEHAWGIYHDLAGNDAWISLRHRYYNSWPVKMVIQKDGVSKRMLMFRRSALLNILLVLAVQGGLFKIK